MHIIHLLFYLCILSKYKYVFTCIVAHEIKEYYTPMDLKIGESLVIYGRAFLLHDCDSFTKAWYYQNFGLTDFKPIDVEIKKPERQKMVSS